jgi:L-asparaginase
MNDEIFNARSVEKTNTINADAFASERGPAGLVNTGKIAWGEPTTKRHTSKSEFDVTKLDTLPRVDIFYAHANMSPDLMEAAVRAGAKGIVVAGVGDGNMTEATLKTLESLRKSGTLVVRSSRVPKGPVLRNSEVNDDKAGFVASGELSPAKSRVLSQLALTKTNDPKKVQEMFNIY